MPSSATISTPSPRFSTRMRGCRCLPSRCGYEDTPTSVGGFWGPALVVVGRVWFRPRPTVHRHSDSTARQLPAEGTSRGHFRSSRYPVSYTHLTLPTIYSV